MWKCQHLGLATAHLVFELVYCVFAVAQFVDFSLGEDFDFERIYIRDPDVESRSFSASALPLNCGDTYTEYKRGIQQETFVLSIMNNQKNDGTAEIDLATSTLVSNNICLMAFSRASLLNTWHVVILPSWASHYTPEDHDFNIFLYRRKIKSICTDFILGNIYSHFCHCLSLGLWV